jgi:hypothetical protein
MGLAFITVAPRDSILYALHQTALTTEEIGLGEAEKMTMAPERKLRTQRQCLEGPFSAAASRATAPGGLAWGRSAAGRVTGTRHALSPRTRQRGMGCKQSLDIPASADPALRLLRGTRDKDFVHLSALKTEKIKKRHLILLRKEE